MNAPAQLRLRVRRWFAALILATPAVVADAAWAEDAPEGAAARIDMELSPRFHSVKVKPGLLTPPEAPLRDHFGEWRWDAAIVASGARSLWVANLTAIRSNADSDEIDRALFTPRELYWQYRGDQIPQVTLGRRVFGAGMAKGLMVVDYHGDISRSIDRDVDFLQDKMRHRIGQIGIGLDSYEDWGSLEIFAAPALTGYSDDLRSNHGRSYYARYSPMLGGSAHVDVFVFHAESRGRLGAAVSADFGALGLGYLEADLSRSRAYAAPRADGDGFVRDSGKTFAAVTAGIESPLGQRLKVTGELSFNGHGLRRAEATKLYERLRADPAQNPDDYAQAIGTAGRIGQLGRGYGFVSLETYSPHRSWSITLSALFNLDDHSGSYNLVGKTYVTDGTELYAILRTQDGPTDSEFGLLRQRQAIVGLRIRF